MGTGAPTRTKEAVRFDSYLKALRNDRKKYLDTMASNNQAEKNEHICPRITKKVKTFFSGENKRVVYNNKWKTNMIEQLKALRNEEWPNMLLVFLKAWDHDSTDLIYQSQISWVDFNNNRSAKLIGSTINVRRYSIIESEEKSFINSGNEEESKENPDEEEESMLNDILQTTDLFEENFYAAHGKQHNSVKSSFALASQLEEKDDEEEKKPKKVKRSFDVIEIEKFKNNTLLGPFTKMSQGSLDDQKTKSMSRLYQSINNYKLVTGLLDKHFQSSTNVFNRMLSSFTEFYVGKYEKIWSSYSQNKTAALQGEIYLSINSAVYDLQQFIRILYDGLNVFYGLEKLKMGDIASKESLFSRDNILNFLTSIVMNTRVFDQIFKLLRINDINTEEAFEKNLAFSCTKSPEDMGIPPEYCLNESTLEYYFGNVNAAFKMLKQATPKNQSKPNGKISAENKKQAEFQDTKVFVDAVFSENRKEGESDLEYTKKLIKEPYIECIKNLKRIEEHRSPIHKMKTIVRTAELINSSIQNFYRVFKIDKPFKLDADQTLSIFIYVVARAEVKSLATQIKLIEKFATNNVLNSISGYYATTLEACINCIINMEGPEEKSQRDSREKFYDNIKTYLRTSNK